MSETTRMEHRPVADLVPDARNARTHSPEQVSTIVGSITEFGFNDPVEILPDGRIVAGHGRVLAAQRMGMDTVPCVVLDHLEADDIRRRAYALANNRIAEMSGWDYSQLQLEIEGLLDSDIPLDIVGFDDEAIAAMHLDGEQDAALDGLGDDAPRDCEEICFTVAIGDGDAIRESFRAIERSMPPGQAPERTSAAFWSLLGRGEADVPS